MELNTLFVGDENAPCLLTRVTEIASYEVRIEANPRCTMTSKCPKCGRTESQIAADAKSLGLLQEFQCGVYNCCQIVEWADEQWLAWFEATDADSRLIDDMNGRYQIDGVENEGVLVPIRLRRQQVPWYRHSDDVR